MPLLVTSPGNIATPSVLMCAALTIALDLTSLMLLSVHDTPVYINVQTCAYIVVFKGHIEGCSFALSGVIVLVLGLQTRLDSSFYYYYHANTGSHTQAYTSECTEGRCHKRISS
ncbi:hypothetical protein CBL_04077 [Carabus blaptoides fortunei]